MDNVALNVIAGALIAIAIALGVSANSQPAGPSGQPEGEVVRMLWGK